MNVPILHPNISMRARSIFRRIYKNEKIDISGSRDTLGDQLGLYFDHLGMHLKKNISTQDRKRVMDIIIRNNQVSSVLKSKDFRKTTEDKKSLLGKTTLGLVYCIDGRIPSIFLGGRYASHWEVPAAEIKIAKRKSDNKLIPESNELCEALRKLVTSEKDLLEIVLAHTSLIDPNHGCGAMAAKRKKGLISKSLSNEDANLKIIEEQTIPAITNIYNDFREQKGFEPLPQIGVSAIYDTDTFGIIFNFGQKDRELSTTVLTNQYKEEIGDFFARENLVYAGFRERFHHLKYLNLFSKNILKITQNLITANHFNELSKTIKEYIDSNYPNLTKNQKKAFLFIVMRTIAFQYLTGACSISKKSLSHPFSHHEEEYMAVSTRGTTLGKYDPEAQGFSSTPADPETAVANIKTKLSIMGGSKNHKSKAYLLFVCNPVNVRDLSENSIQLHKIMDANAELFRAILNDSDLSEMICTEKLLLISLLIDEDTREVLKIIDHSAYI